MNLNEAKRILKQNGYILEAEDQQKRLTKEEAIEKYGRGKWDMTDEAKAELQKDPVYKEYYKLGMEVIEKEIHKNDPDAKRYLKTIHRYYDGSPEEELALNKAIFNTFIDSDYPHIFYWGPKRRFHGQFENMMFLRHVVSEYLELSPACKEMSEINQKNRHLENISDEFEYEQEQKIRREKLQALKDKGCKCQNCAYFDMSRSAEKFGFGYSPESYCMYKSRNEPRKWTDVCLMWKNRFPKKEEA